MKHVRFMWLFTMALVTVIFVVIYLTGQAILRMSANDPQTQMANDTAYRAAIDIKEDGKLDLNYPVKVQLDVSLAPFTIIYDTDKKVIASSVELEGRTPEIPESVFDNVSQGNRNIVTWQPQDGPRVATVIVSAGEYGYVLSGRSLAEYDKRIGSLNKFIAVSWFCTLIFITAAFALKSRRS